MRRAQAEVWHQLGSTSLTAEPRIRSGLGNKTVLTSSRVSSASSMTRKSSRASCPESPAGFCAGKRCRAVKACNPYPSAQPSKRAAVILLSPSFSFSVVRPTASVFQPSRGSSRRSALLSAPRTPPVDAARTRTARPRGAAGWERRACVRRVCGWELW